MGMFDTVDFFCPYCNEILPEQSKAGECDLKKYKQTSIPADIAIDLVDNKIPCPICDKVFIICGSIPRVSLYLKDQREDEDYD